MHPPEPAQRSRVVMNRRNRSVGDAFCIHEVRPRHLDQAPYVVVRFADRRIAGIDDGQTADVEVISVSTGRNRTKSGFPDPVFTFQHGSSLAVTRDIAAAYLHALDVWGQQAENDMAVCSD